VTAVLDRIRDLCRALRARLFALGFAGRFADIEASIGEVSRVADAVGHAGAIICCDYARSLPFFLRSGDLPGLERVNEANGTTTAAPPLIVRIALASFCRRVARATAGRSGLALQGPTADEPRRASVSSRADGSVAYLGVVRQRIPYVS